MIHARQGILVPYLIGMPVGLFTVLLTMLIPSMLTGEGILSLVLAGIYDKATIALIIAFLVALGIGGRNAGIDVFKQKPLIKASFKYSLTVNVIIWIVFILTTMVTNETEHTWLVVILPVFAFGVCTIVTTYTLGLLICRIIKKRSSLVTRQ